MMPPAGVIPPPNPAGSMPSLAPAPRLVPQPAQPTPYVPGNGNGNGLR
jgi:hypothetical protein